MLKESVLSHLGYIPRKNSIQISEITRSGPNIPTAGNLEGQGLFGFRDIVSNYACSNELQITVNARTSKFWNFVRQAKFWNFVRTTEFGTS